MAVVVGDFNGAAEDAKAFVFQKASVFTGDEFGGGDPSDPSLWTNTYTHSKPSGTPAYSAMHGGYDLTWLVYNRRAFELSVKVVPGRVDPLDSMWHGSTGVLAALGNLSVVGTLPAIENVIETAGAKMVLRKTVQTVMHVTQYVDINGIPLKSWSAQMDDLRAAGYNPITYNPGMLHVGWDDPPEGSPDPQKKYLVIDSQVTESYGDPVSMVLGGLKHDAAGILRLTPLYYERIIDPEHPENPPTGTSLANGNPAKADCTDLVKKYLDERNNYETLCMFCLPPGGAAFVSTDPDDLMDEIESKVMQDNIGWTLTPGVGFEGAAGYVPTEGGTVTYYEWYYNSIVASGLSFDRDWNTLAALATTSRNNYGMIPKVDY